MLGLKLPSDPRWVNIAEKNIEEIIESKYDLNSTGNNKKYEKIKLTDKTNKRAGTSLLILRT